MRVGLRRRMSVVVLAGDPGASDRGARALADSLREAGQEVVYLGREPNAARIAALAGEVGADAVEVCVAGGGAALFLRGLLRELKSRDRGGVSIVLRRVQ